MERCERDAQASVDMQASADVTAKHKAAASAAAEHTVELELAKPVAPEAEQIHAPV